ncbi:MAG: cytochrome P450 [Pseudomonadales bacterium]
MNSATLKIDSYHGAMAALKNPALAQALYEAGGLVMNDALITLHGEAHSQRRVVEFSVFSRSFFREYERSIFPAALKPVLDPHLHSGQADLVELGYRVTMNLTADFAGIDRPLGSAAETDALLAMVKTFSEGATLVHSTRDHAEVNREVRTAMDRFETTFLLPSRARRLALLADVEAGHAAPESLPRDVMTVLLRNRDRIPLTDEVFKREIAFFLQAGAHSTGNATTHAMHEIWQWLNETGTTAVELLNEPLLLQRCVHESLRLHPASPVAWRRAQDDLVLNEESVAKGSAVILDLQAANRDRSVFGEDAERFNPHRALPQGVWPFGLTFGYGVHACLGRDLDGGVVAKPGANLAEHQFGIVPLMVRTLLSHGARPNPEEPPSADANTQRQNWGHYPILLDMERSA